MSQITKSDFADWQLNKVTKAFFQAALERVEDCKDVLASSAGIDSVQDNLLRGMVHAYREMREFRIDFDEDNQNDD